MITGDHKTIAVETARVLGMGVLIQGPQGLPVLAQSHCLDSVLDFPWHDLAERVLIGRHLFWQVLDADGKAPLNLPENYGALIVPSCGFAQVGSLLSVFSRARFLHRFPRLDAGADRRCSQSTSTSS
jgi:hypothetical protein